MGVRAVSHVGVHGGYVDDGGACGIVASCRYRIWSGRILRGQTSLELTQQADMAREVTIVRVTRCIDVDSIYVG